MDVGVNQELPGKLLNPTGLRVYERLTHVDAIPGETPVISCANVFRRNLPVTATRHC